MNRRNLILKLAASDELSDEFVNMAVERISGHRSHFFLHTAVQTAISIAKEMEGEITLQKLDEWEEQLDSSTFLDDLLRAIAQDAILKMRIELS